MARIRTVKPEFWEDETVGTLSRDARLLFIATFNMADDEGLLRWSVAYIKAQAFVYDEDMSAVRVSELMSELATSGVVYPYRGGKSQQQLGMIVNFHKHQRVNRPQPSKLPPPSLQNSEIRLLYARRDGFVCHLCGYPTLETLVAQAGSPSCLCPSPDHVRPQSIGGTDYPGNIRNSHIGCNKARGEKPIDAVAMPQSVASALGVSDSVTQSHPDSLNDSMIDSVNGSLPYSPPEGKGMEGNGMEQGGEGKRPPAKRGCQLPDTWTPTEQHILKASELELDLKDEVEGFRDHFTATGVTRKDWDASFRTWLRNSAKWGNSRRNPNRSTNGGPNWDAAMNRAGNHLEIA